MLLDWILVCCIFFFAPFFPPVLVPVGFSMIGVLLINGADPRGLAISVSLSALCTYIPLRIIEGYLLDKIGNYKKNTTSGIGQYLKSLMLSFDNTTIIHKTRLWFKDYIDTKHGKFTLFCFAVIFAAPVIPDIVTVSLFRRRMSLGVFLLAGFLGKLITFVPSIFLGKNILLVFVERFQKYSY